MTANEEQRNRKTEKQQQQLKHTYRNLKRILLLNVGDISLLVYHIIFVQHQKEQSRQSGEKRTERMKEKHCRAIHTQSHMHVHCTYNIALAMRRIH